MMCFYRILLVSILIISADTAWSQRLRIVVGGPNFRPYPIAVPRIVINGDENKTVKKLTREFSRILRTNVDLARPLELVPPKTYLESNKENWTRPEFVNWANVGASGLIWGELKLDVKQVKITLRFYDVVSQREILTRDYKENIKFVSVAVHKFLDEIIELLTGEKGIFSSRIAYIKATKNGKAIFVCDIDGGSPIRVTDEDVLSLLPAWDAAGHHLLFTSYLKNNPDLFRLNLLNRNLEWLSNKRGLNTGASVSPNGKRIALTLSIDGNTEIYVMDWDTKNLERLTDSWGQDVSPSWSFDGKKIAFVSSRSGNPHIYTMNADGTNQKRLTFQGNYNQEPDWSPRPDGQIAFTARDERLKYDIFLVHPESSEITRLTQDEGNNESPAHSPDGHHLVFTSTRGPQRGKKLYVMDVDGNNQRRVSKGTGYYETPAWGPRLGYPK